VTEKYSRILLLIDGDNVSDEAWPAIKTFIQKLGRVHKAIAVRNSTGDSWRFPHDELELEELPYRVDNGADFRLAVRFGEMLSQSPDALVVVSGDPDFAALLAEARHIHGLATFCLTLPTNDHYLSKLASAAEFCLVLPPLKNAGHVGRDCDEMRTPSSTEREGDLRLAILYQALNQRAGVDGWCKIKDLGGFIHNLTAALQSKHIKRELMNYVDHFEFDPSQTQIRALKKLANSHIEESAPSA
jgi:hypothetical protein